MKNRALKSICALSLGLISGGAFANAHEPVEVDVYLTPLRFEEVKFVDSNGQSASRYKVDGVDIEINKTDYIKSKNWNLGVADWARYKYIMDYTPRGIWTPNLDPPIVLGNYAKSDAERMRYARIMNELEIDRRNREVAFQEAGIAHLKTLNPMLGLPAPKEGLARYLKDGKVQLRSLFFEPDACDSACGEFMMDVFASTSSNTQLNIYYVNATRYKASSFLASIGITDSRLDSKEAELISDSEQYLRFIGEGSLPYLVLQNDSGVTTRYHEK
ncbi:hypothetical protein [Vibrio mediterranei]|uniref:hypothetical protein n=1 Tax=Vibrio mediterranei TaxID=689 RepID=UPI0040681748